MKTYLILKEKAEQWNADKEIQCILKEISKPGNGIPSIADYSKQNVQALLGHVFDKDEIVKKRLPYEHLDQLTVEILLGVR
jgi:xylose isomerase